jgi:hypothetical protein
MSTDTELHKGMRVSRRGLLDHARVHIGLEEKYRAALVERGWTEALGQRLRETTAVVDSEMAAAIEARVASRDKLAREQAAISRAKALKSDLTHAVSDLYADGAVGHEALDAIRGRGMTALRRSTSLISTYLADVEPQVRALDDALKPYFRGESAHAELLAAKTELDDAQAIQELAVAHLPEETRKVYLAKATVLGLIEKMNRLAKLAFKGHAETVGRFNKDLILRARQTRKAASSGAEARTSPPPSRAERAALARAERGGGGWRGAVSTSVCSARPRQAKIAPWPIPRRSLPPTRIYSVCRIISWRRSSTASSPPCRAPRSLTPASRPCSVWTSAARSSAGAGAPAAG